MDISKIGKFISELRNEKNLTQDNLAKILYVDRTTVSKWERGIRLPELSTLISISKLFDVSVDELLAGERNTKENVLYSLYDRHINVTKLLLVLKYILCFFIVAIVVVVITLVICFKCF